MISSETSLSSHENNNSGSHKNPDEIEFDIENRSNSPNQNSPNYSINDSAQSQVKDKIYGTIIDNQKKVTSNIIEDILNDSNSDKIAVKEVQSSLFAQIAHISEFLANAELSPPNKKTNPCLQMLSDFFEVFNQQLQINFNIRNKLNEETKANPIDPKKVDEKRNEIDIFLKEFRKIVSTSKKNYSDIIDPVNIEKSFNNIITLIQNGVKKTAKLKNLYKEIEIKKNEITNIINEIQVNERMLKDAKENAENRSNSIQKQIDESRDQILKMKSSIDGIIPNISNMKAQIQNEAKLRQNLSEMVSKRKSQIEIARQTFLEVENKQKEKLQKYGVKLSKLKIERRQLLIDEQPLISALEDAESELKTHREVAESEIKTLNKEKKEIEEKLMESRNKLDEFQRQKAEIKSVLQQKESEINDCSLKEHEVDENIKILSKKIIRINQIKRDLLRKLNQKSTKIKNKIQISPNKSNQEIDSNQKNDSDDNNNYNENNYSPKVNNNFNQYFQENDIDDLIRKSIDDELTHLEDSSSQYKDQIKEIRKENSKIRSMIRVNKEKISKLIEENQKLSASNLISEKEVEKLSIDANAQKQRYSIFKSTMNEYERMRKALGFHSSMLPSEVAKHTVSMIRSWKQVELDEERAKEFNGKISINSINEDFEYIFGEINDVESKLYRANP